MEPPVASTNLVRKAKEKKMAKDTEKVEKKEKSPREIRWEKFVEGYAVQSPVKYASKKANGEFDQIPASFE